VLKKTGIIAAVAVAGVIALTPFAFANNDTPAPAPEMASIESDNLSNDCPITQTGQELTTDAQGGDSFAGLAGAVVNAQAPVSAPIALGNCLNVELEDVADFNSNNDTTTRTSTEVEDSFNEEG
jgi:hypothetical protein